jgi:hypothetical protein
MSFQSCASRIRGMLLMILKIANSMPYRSLTGVRRVYGFSPSALSITSVPLQVRVHTVGFEEM